jgi:hypothetical protein
MSLQSSHQIDPKFLPNLPGFKPKGPNTGMKKSYFKLVEGQVFLKDEYIPTTTSLDGDEGTVGSLGNTLANSTVSRARKQLALTNANVILNFSAYFEEKVEGRNQTQIRQCNIFFYVDDGSVKIVEKPQLNAGVNQGTLVKRAVVFKLDGTPFAEEDFHVGEWVTIYGRNFK